MPERVWSSAKAKIIPVRVIKSYWASITERWKNAVLLNRVLSRMHPARNDVWLFGACLLGSIVSNTALVVE